MVKSSKPVTYSDNLLILKKEVFLITDMVVIWLIVVRIK